VFSFILARQRGVFQRTLLNGRRSISLTHVEMLNCLQEPRPRRANWNDPAD
jgi:hypothetical protein